MVLELLSLAREGDVPQRARDHGLRIVVERHILAEIRLGHFQPGDRLHEAKLAEAVGVSPTPVREALFRLAHDGVVVHKPRRGFFLAEFGTKQMADVLTLRAALEGLAAAQAATHILPEEIADLERLIDEGVHAARAGDPLRTAECNAAFHALLIRAARHSLLERAWSVIAPLRWLLIPASAPQLTPDGIADWEARHRRLLDAVRSGKPDLAEQAARDHVFVSAHGARVRRERAGRQARDAARTRRSK
jgi:DNA-binding GntR family transcriptional regulator